MSTSVEQTALLAGPICIGQAQGEGTQKRGAEGRALPHPARWHAPPLSSLPVFGLARPHASRMDSPAIV